MGRKLDALKLLADLAEVASRAYGNVADRVLAKEKSAKEAEVNHLKDAQIAILKDQLLRLEKDAEIRELKKRIEELERKSNAT